MRSLEGLQTQRVLGMAGLCWHARSSSIPPTYRPMPLRRRTLALRRAARIAVLWAAAGTAGMAPAQLPAPAADAACQAEAASLGLDMEAARSKGQMLRHRQLADQRAALSARCPMPAPAANRAEQVQRLEQAIRQLKSELQKAEADLARLKLAP